MILQALLVFSLSYLLLQLSSLPVVLQNLLPLLLLFSLSYLLLQLISLPVVLQVVGATEAEAVMPLIISLLCPLLLFLRSLFSPLLLLLLSYPLLQLCAPTGYGPSRAEVLGWSHCGTSRGEWSVCGAEEAPHHCCGAGC